MKCRWTDMNVLHYASFFDCSSLVEALVKANKGLFHCTHTCTLVRIYVQADAYECICTYTHAHTHTHTHTCIHIRAYTHKHTHTNIHTQTYTHKHTHIQLLSCTDLLNATSKQFDGGTSLHIAAANANLQATRTLVSN